MSLALLKSLGESLWSCASSCDQSVFLPECNVHVTKCISRSKLIAPVVQIPRSAVLPLRNASWLLI